MRRKQATQSLIKFTEYTFERYPYRATSKSPGPPGDQGPKIEGAPTPQR